MFYRWYMSLSKLAKMYNFLILIETLLKKMGPFIICGVHVLKQSPFGKWLKISWLKLLVTRLT